MRKINDFVERVKCAAVQITGGERDDGGHVRVFFQFDSQCVDIDDAILVHINLDNGIRADAEVPQCAQQCLMVLTNQHADRRAARQSLLFHRPAPVCQHLVAGR